MAKQLNINIKTTGAKEVQEDLKKIGEAGQTAGEKAAKGGKRGSEGVDRLGHSADKTSKKVKDSADSLGQWAAKMASVTAAIALVNQAIRDQIDLMEEQGRKTAEHTASLIKAQTLGEWFRDEPDLGQKITAVSNQYGIGYSDVANAFYLAKSSTPQKPTDWIVRLVSEAAELKQTDPTKDGPTLEQLTNAISLFSVNSGIDDTNRVQNIIQQAITEAKSSLPGLSSYLPKFLPIGMSGGLTHAETTGLWAYATQRLTEPSIATTALEATFMGLEGKGTPESQDLLKRLGIKKDATFFEKLMQLNKAASSGKFDLKAAESFAGREGASMLLGLIRNPEALAQTVKNIQAVDRSDLDLVGNIMTDLKSQDPKVVDEFLLRQADTTEENVLGNDPVALRKLRILRQYKTYLRARGFGATRLYTNFGLEKLAMVPLGTLESVERRLDVMKAMNPGFADYLDDQTINETIMEGNLYSRRERYGTLPQLGDKARDEFNRRILGASPSTTIFNSNDVIINYNRIDTPAKPICGPEDIN